MKIFIFEDVGQLTDNYHSGGGLVIIAKDEEEARKLAQKDRYINLSKIDWEFVEILELKDSKQQPRIYIFENAGCC